MDEKELSTIPYVVYKVLEAKYERLIKRLAFALGLTNTFWFILFLFR